MIIEATPAESRVAEQIHAISQAAYTLEATRIGCADFPPLRESLDALRQSPDTFLVFQESGRIVGALSFDRRTAPLTITRLVVSPTHHRQGIATALLAELEQRLDPMTQFSVTTAKANIAALLLYQRCGYTTTGSSTSAEGIPLIHLAKSKGSD